MVQTGAGASASIMGVTRQSGLIAIQKRRLQRLLSPGETLSQRVVRGGVWVFALRITNRLLGLARTIVLARVLAPSDFGLMGIALLAISTLKSFSQTGFQAALIQKKEDIKDYLDTAWTVSALRGLFLFVILYLAAPYIALFFDTPAATPLMRVIGISVLLNGLTNIAVVYFQKELEFNKQFVYSLSGTLADVIVAIPAALLLRNVWALVFGLLAGNFVRFIMSYLVHSFRPSFKLDWEKSKELLNFGKYIFAQSIVLFLLRQGDDAFVGRVLGTTALGFYRLAYRFSNMAATEITHVVSQVTIPAYSKLQDEADKLRRALTETLRFIALISIPLASGIFILAPEFTRAFLGEKWMPMVPAMQVMCLFGAMRSVGATFGPVYRAIARVDIPLKISVTQLVFLATIIYPLSSYWKVLGTAIAITSCAVVALCLTSKMIMGILDIDFVSLFRPVFVSISASIGMIAMILLLKTYVLKTVSYMTVLSLAAIGGICYLGFVFAAYKTLGYDLKDPMKTFRNYYNGA